MFSWRHLPPLIAFRDARARATPTNEKSAFIETEIAESDDAKLGGAPSRSAISIRAEKKKKTFFRKMDRDASVASKRNSSRIVLSGHFASTKKDARVGRFERDRGAAGGRRGDSAAPLLARLEDLRKRELRKRFVLFRVEKARRCAQSRFASANGVLRVHRARDSSRNRVN